MKRRGNSTTSHRLPRGEAARRKNARQAKQHIPAEKEGAVSIEPGALLDRVTKKHGKVSATYDGRIYRVYDNSEDVVGSGKTRRHAMRFAALKG